MLRKEHGKKVAISPAVLEGRNRDWRRVEGTAIMAGEKVSKRRVAEGWQKRGRDDKRGGG